VESQFTGQTKFARDHQKMWMYNAALFTNRQNLTISSLKTLFLLT
jgi:hypothetical protein